MAEKRVYTKDRGRGLSPRTECEVLLTHATCDDREITAKNAGPQGQGWESVRRKRQDAAPPGRRVPTVTAGVAKETQWRASLNLVE